MQYVRFLLAALVLCGLWYVALEPRKKTGEFDWRWGMDFKGGVQLVYELKPGYLKKRGLKLEDIKKKMDDSRERLRRRVVAFAKTEESKVVILGDDQILVEIPGTQNIEKVKKEIGKPHYLTIRGILEEADQPPEDEPNWFQLPIEKKWVRLSNPGATGEHILFDKFGEPFPSGDPESGRAMRWAFALPLSEEGQDSFAEFTTTFENQRTAILLDDEIHDVLWVMSGGLREPQIEVNSDHDARRLMKLLRSGPLPLPFELVQQKTVSPVLAAMRESSIRAISFGVLFLILFFGFNYLHRPFYLLVTLGAVALEVGLFIVIANEGLIRISLPQLAGLALLIGMSVDAFILVFEHIEQDIDSEPSPTAEAGDGDEEEEQVEVSELEAAIELSRKAFATEFGVIFWANVTTILSLGGLYFVRGVLNEYFVLLALGVCISLSAAIFLRMLMGVNFLVGLTHWANRKKPFAPWLTWIRGIDLTKHAPQMTRFYKIAVPVALLIVVVGSLTGWTKLGIDFSGGTVVVVQLPKEGAPVSPEKVRKLADDVFGLDCEVQFSAEERHYGIRVPKMLTQDVGGESIAHVASVATGATPGKTAIETLLIQKLKQELGQDVTLVGVDQLGSAAALDNTLSSMGNVLWGFLVLTILCAILYVSVTVPFWVVVALVVDILLVLAAIVLLRIPIDYPMIAAFLTFAGYSINDSIVVCHSIKALGKPHMDEFVQADDPRLKEKIDHAIAMGLKPLSSRVFLTSITTMFTMTPLLFCDGVLQTFGIIFVLGTAFGTLSSVFIVGIRASDIVMGDTQTLD